MNWRKSKGYYQESTDERYIVCSYGLKPLYEAWRSVLHPQGRLQLASQLETAAAARQVCEQDAEKSA